MLDWEIPQPPADPQLCFIDWGRVGLGVATGGLSEAGGIRPAAEYIYGQTYGKDNREQHAAAQYAEDASKAYGQKMLNYYGGQNQTAQGYFTQGANSPDAALTSMRANRPGQQQDYLNYMKGQAGGLTNQEQLYNERKGGNDPAAAYQDQRAMEQINRQLAARGMANSTPGVRQITDYQANIGAQRAMQLASLAGGADSSRQALSQGYGGAAQGASGEQRGYFNDVLGGASDLAGARASTQAHFADQGGAAMSESEKMAMEARLQAMGIDAATRHQVMSDLSGVATGALKLALA